MQKEQSSLLVKFYKYIKAVNKKMIPTHFVLKLVDSNTYFFRY
jgi:hypothetical protein